MSDSSSPWSQPPTSGARDPRTPLGRARVALEGLSIGDAFGERFFGSRTLVESRIAARAMPAIPWRWTDDTAMALGIFEVLHAHGAVDRDALARAFAARYVRDPARGYGGTAHGVLQAIGRGVAWQAAAGGAFDGEGSMGNGGAMRAAPVGAYFADDFAEVARQARASAEPTHAHPDGQAGAIAVAIAAAVAWRMRATPWTRAAGGAFLREIAAHTPAGPTCDGVERAATLPLESDVHAAVEALGNGSHVISSDTVPFSLWCAARHMGDFEDALWATVSGLGDRDTTCAIVGGIVALHVGPRAIPEHFARAREPLD